MKRTGGTWKSLESSRASCSTQVRWMCCLLCCLTNTKRSSLSFNPILFARTFTAAAIIADQNAKLSIFCTRPAIYTPVRHVAVGATSPCPPPFTSSAVCTHPPAHHVSAPRTPTVLAYALSYLANALTVRGPPLPSLALPLRCSTA